MDGSMELPTYASVAGMQPSSFKRNVAIDFPRVLRRTEHINPVTCAGAVAFDKWTASVCFGFIWPADDRYLEKCVHSAFQA